MKIKASNFFFKMGKIGPSWAHIFIRQPSAEASNCYSLSLSLPQSPPLPILSHAPHLNALTAHTWMEKSSETRIPSPLKAIVRRLAFILKAVRIHWSIWEREQLDFYDLKKTH